MGSVMSSLPFDPNDDKKKNTQAVGSATVTERIQTVDADALVATWGRMVSVTGVNPMVPATDSRRARSPQSRFIYSTDSMTEAIGKIISFGAGVNLIGDAVSAPV
jgi:hypothetical protein